MAPIAPTVPPGLVCGIRIREFVAASRSLITSAEKPLLTGQLPIASKRSDGAANCPSIDAVPPSGKVKRSASGAKIRGAPIERIALFACKADLT